MIVGQHVLQSSLVHAPSELSSNPPHPFAHFASDQPQQVSSTNPESIYQLQHQLQMAQDVDLLSDFGEAPLASLESINMLSQQPQKQHSLLQQQPVQQMSEFEQDFMMSQQPPAVSSPSPSRGTAAAGLIWISIQSNVSQFGLISLLCV